MTKRILTQQELKSQLHYNPETGIFTRVKTGVVAGGINKIGYIMVSINNIRYYAHRLAFLYMTGKMPIQGDHINMVRDDNRWSNLRDATKQQNMRNVKLQRNNTSGFKGVVYIKSKWRLKRWNAQAKLNGKKISLGYYETPQLASEAYQAFAREHHADFYRQT